MKGRKSNIDRANEIKRLYAAGWPIVAIAHELGCGETLVGYYTYGKDKGEPSGVKAKVGSKPGTVYHRPNGKDLTPEQIDEIFAGEKFENEKGKEWL